MSEYNLVIIYNITYFLELQFKKKIVMKLSVV